MDDFEQRCKEDPSLVNDLRKKKKPGKVKNEDETNKASVKSSSKKAKEPAPQKPAKQQSSTAKRSGSKTNQNVASNNQKTGFDEGLSAEKIMGATNATGKLMFLVKW